MVDPSPSSYKTCTKGLILVDPRDGRTHAAAGTRGVAAVFELHAAGTQYPMGSACVMQLTCGNETPGPRAHAQPAAKARLGASSLVTAHSARGGRVCELKRVGPCKVTSEAGLNGLGLSPRLPSSI